MPVTYSHHIGFYGPYMSYWSCVGHDTWALWSKWTFDILLWEQSLSFSYMWPCDVECREDGWFHLHNHLCCLISILLPCWLTIHLINWGQSPSNLDLGLPRLSLKSTLMLTVWLEYNYPKSRSLFPGLGFDVIMSNQYLIHQFFPNDYWMIGVIDLWWRPAGRSVDKMEHCTLPCFQLHGGFS